MRNFLIALITVCFTGVVFYGFLGQSKLPPLRHPLPSDSSLVASSAPSSGGMQRSWDDGFAGVGWSTNPQTSDAIEEAVAHAWGKQPSTPEITFVYYNPQHDAKNIIKSLRRGTRPIGRIFGETTHEGILCSDGYHASPSGVLGILTMHYPNISVGVGIASFDGQTPGEATSKALAAAIKDAGKRFEGQKPSMVLLNVTLPHEEEVLDALTNDLGPNIPVIGGTAAGSVDGLSRKKISNWSIVVNDEMTNDGVGIAAIYTNTPLAWAYGGGFRRTTLSGIVTKTKSRLILEIDGKPAADVYNEWLGGRVYEAMERGENIAKFCGLYPVCRVLGGKNQFIRAWPSEDPRWPGSLRTGSNVQDGDELFLSEGNWNMLLNYFGTIPDKARASYVEYDAGAALLLYCGGALACIPKENRNQMNVLVNHSMGKSPWIGVFTWGEQGNIPGVGNVHSNLSSGTILFPVREPIK